MPKRKLSIVIPTYNEEARLPPTLDTVLAWADETEVFDIEIIIVDDGSQDRTCEVVRRYAEEDSRVRLVEECHVGAMHAVLSGFRQANYALVGNMDADCAVHPREFEKFVNYVGERSIAQGSRVLRGDLPAVEGKSLVRRLMSAVMSSLFVTLFRCEIRDPQIGFRLYTKDAVMRIVPLMRLRHDGLKIAEIIVRGHGLGMEIHEFPVPYHHDDDSRTVPKSPLKATIVTLFAFLAVLQVWVQCGIDYRRGLLSRNPVRGGLLFLPFALFKFKPD